MQHNIHHYNRIAVAATIYLEPQLKHSMPNGIHCYPCHNDTGVSPMSLEILYVLFPLSAIFVNVRCCATVRLQSLLLRGSASRSYPIVLNCHCHGWHCCHYHHLCFTLHHCSAWTIPYNVPHLMISVALLSIPPIGTATGIFLNFQTTTITHTATIKDLLELPNVLEFHISLFVCNIENMAATFEESLCRNFASRAFIITVPCSAYLCWVWILPHINWVWNLQWSRSAIHCSW